MRIYTVDAENIVNEVGRMIDEYMTELSIQDNINQHDYYQRGEILFEKKNEIIEAPELQSIIDKLGDKQLVIKGGDGYLIYKYKYIVKRNGNDYIVVSKGLGIY